MAATSTSTRSPPRSAMRTVQRSGRFCGNASDAVCASFAPTCADDPPLRARLDHDRLDLAVAGAGAMARAERLGHEIRCGLQLAGIPGFDLAAQRRTLAECDRGVLCRWRVADLGARLDRDVAEARAFEVGP